MNCQSIRTLLPLHLYGDLAAAERLAVQTHLGACPGCQAELSALGLVRQGLDCAAVPPVVADVAGIYRAEADRLKRRARRWRGAAIVMAVAAVVVLALRLDIRADSGQLVVRWGHLEAPPAPIVQTVVVKSEPQTPPGLDERLDRMSALIGTLAASVDVTDRQMQKDFGAMRQEVASIRQELTGVRPLQKRLAQTERDVSALYAAQFHSRTNGVNP